MNMILAGLFLTLGVLCLFLSVFLSDPQLTRIPLDKNNRMLRCGFGKHEGKWFARIDLWFVAFRVA